MTEEMKIRNSLDAIARVTARLRTGAGPARRYVRDDDGPWNACGVQAYATCVALWSEYLGTVRATVFLDCAEGANAEGRALGYLWAAYLGE